MDTVIDPAGVEALLEIILEDKIRYWDAVIEWAVENNFQDRIVLFRMRRPGFAELHDH